MQVIRLLDPAQILLTKGLRKDSPGPLPGLGIPFDAGKQLGLGRGQPMKFFEPQAARMPGTDDIRLDEARKIRIGEGAGLRLLECRAVTGLNPGFGFRKTGKLLLEIHRLGANCCGQPEDRKAGDQDLNRDPGSRLEAFHLQAPSHGEAARETSDKPTQMPRHVQAAMGEAPKQVVAQEDEGVLLELVRDVAWYVVGARVGLYGGLV